MTTDYDELAIVVIADYTVPVGRVWEAFLDPRQIERFWGRPSHPAAFDRHDGTPGGRSGYVTTAPDGSRSRHCWEWTEVDAPHRFEVRDRAAAEDGTPDADDPGTRVVVEIDESPFGSRLTMTTRFESSEQLEQLLFKGLNEGMRSAVAQIDAVVAE